MAADVWSGIWVVVGACAAEFKNKLQGCGGGAEALGFRVATLSALVEGQGAGLGVGPSFNEGIPCRRGMMGFLDWLAHLIRPELRGREITCAPFA